MISIELHAPNKKFQTTVEAAVKEFQLEKSGAIPWYYNIQKSFENYVDELNDRLHTETETKVPESVFWAIHNNEFVGRISIRHKLNEKLKIHGGHIGYETRPSYRQKGVASQMLGLALKECQKLGIKKALLTCADTNEASWKIIERHGGVLEKKAVIQPENKLARYYWISID